jgi:hypothetical protein
MVMACSFMRIASGEEQGFSSILCRMEMASNGSSAFEARAIESVVAGRYDAVIAAAARQLSPDCLNIVVK